MNIELANRGPLIVRREHFRSATNSRHFKVLYASDLHLFRVNQSRICDQLLNIVSESKPDVTLLGGDLVDRARALPNLENLVRSMADYAPVAAVAGNHDSWIGTNSVRDAVKSAGGIWLTEGSLEIPLAHSGAIHIDGRPQLVQSANCLRVLCAHDPVIFPQACEAGYDLVLAGHLHGCQVIWKEF